MKYIGNEKKIINFCLKSSWLTTDPFLGYNKTRREVIKDYLTNEELNVISEKQFILQRLDMVRDIFVFSCYTLLAYAKMKQLKLSEIDIGIHSNTNRCVSGKAGSYPKKKTAKKV